MESIELLSESFNPLKETVRNKESPFYYFCFLFVRLFNGLFVDLSFFWLCPSHLRGKFI